jgi:hypothetical protein
MVLAGVQADGPRDDFRAGEVRAELRIVAVNRHGIIADISTAATIPIDNLSTADKIVLMERLWEHLSRRSADIVSPDWHGDVLADRRAAVLEGRTSFIDWEEAKKRLRERLP